MAITWDFSGSVQILCHGGRPAGLHRIAGSLPRNRMDAPDSHAQGPDSASPSQIIPTNRCKSIIPANRTARIDDTARDEQRA